MATMGVYTTTTIQALEDLSSHQYQAIALDDGKVANNGLEASGILLNKPRQYEHATLAWHGEIKFRAGGAVTAGARLRVATSGYFVTGNSGYYDVGRSKFAVTSGSIGTGYFNFTNPVYRVSSL